MPKVRLGMRPVVFADLDDVFAIHQKHNSFQVLAAFKNAALDDVPSLWKHIFDASACKNLRTLHDEFAPEYVISSSWASFLDRAQICEVLRRTGLEFVVENLHQDWRTPREDGSYRLTEIDKWLDTHALEAPLPYVILDDHLSGQSLPGSHLDKRAVLCDAWIGFTHPKLRSAQKILRDQLRRHGVRTRD
ncbi:MAG: HAD domain-containing protein [Pseudomonadota bacterium]